jgi:hypothetical protein
MNKYQPLLNDIIEQGWKVDPLIVITAGARGTTHAPSMDTLKEKFKIREVALKQTFKDINTIAIHHVESILLHKKKLENHQPLPTE